MADPGVAGKKRETAIMYCIMVSYAVFMTLVGAVLTSLLDEFGLPIARGGMFYSTQNVGSFLGILLSGVVIDRYGKRKLILLIYAGFIAPLLSFLVAGSLPAVLCVLFLAGMAAKLIDAILNARVSEMYAENKAFHLNLLHCCFAVGCLLGPLLAGAVLRTGMSWRVSYFSLGVVCLVLFFVYALVVRRDGGAKAAAPGPESAAGWSELSRPRMLLLCLAILFYSLYEGGISNWLPTYLTETLGVDKAIAGSSISALWFGLIVSRLAGSVLAKRLGERSIFFIGA